MTMTDNNGLDLLRKKSKSKNKLVSSISNYDNKSVKKNKTYKKSKKFDKI